MKVIDKNKHYGKPKMKCFEMPNASYTNRSLSCSEKSFRSTKKEVEITLRVLKKIFYSGIFSNLSELKVKMEFLITEKYQVGIKKDVMNVTIFCVFRAVGVVSPRRYATGPAYRERSSFV